LLKLEEKNAEKAKTGFCHDFTSSSERTETLILLNEREKVMVEGFSALRV
jgi:hypothetical protein